MRGAPRMHAVLVSRVRRETTRFSERKRHLSGRRPFGEGYVFFAVEHRPIAAALPIQPLAISSGRDRKKGPDGTLELRNLPDLRKVLRHGTQDASKKAGRSWIRLPGLAAPARAGRRNFMR